MWNISDIKDVKKKDKDVSFEHEHIYTCKLKNLADDEFNSDDQLTKICSLASRCGIYSLAQESF